MKVGGSWCVLPVRCPGSQPLIKTSALTSRFLCSEGLRAALPLAGGGQRVKLDVSPSPAVKAPTNTGPGLVASQGAMMEPGRGGDQGNSIAQGPWKLKQKSKMRWGKQAEAIASPWPGIGYHGDAARCAGHMQWMHW